MVRNVLRRLGQLFKTAFTARRSLHGIVIGITLLTIWILINLTSMDSNLKLSFFVFVVLIFLFGEVLTYRSRKRTPAKHTIQSEGDEEQENNHDHLKKEDVATSLIPQMPSNPPTISAESNIDTNQSDDFALADDNIVVAKAEENPALYRYSFSFKIVLFKIILAISFWVSFLVGTIILNSAMVWWILGGLTIGVPIYCYYLVLRWSGEEFIVNDIWFERPLTMPFPFHNKTPAIRRSEIGKYEIKETTLDRMLGLCRLYSDTPSARDKNFHNVKWLPHPAELRRATGISAPRKNSWLSPFRRKKE